MNIKSLLFTTAFAALAGPAFAQQAPMPGQPAPAQNQRPGPFERLDTNSDGVITRDEVRALRTLAFNRLDTDRDGFLVQAELAAAREGMRNGGGRGDMMDGGSGGHPKMGHDGGGHLLSRADTDNDGNVTRAEFDSAGRTGDAAKAGQRDQQRAAMFQRLDTDRNGTISAAEIAAARAARPQQGGQQGTMPAGGQGRGALSADTNNDKKVSQAEWLARPDPLFDRGDANRDGRVTREEAAAIVRQGRGQNGRPNRPW